MAQSKAWDVRVKLDDRKIGSFLADITDSTARRAAGRVVGRAQAFAPHRTGKLRRSITAKRDASQSIRNEKTVYIIRSRGVAYADYQEFGTGPIYPVRAKVLAFKPKGGNAVIFRPSTRGVPATNYMGKAYTSITSADFL